MFASTFFSSAAFYLYRNDCGFYALNNLEKWEGEHVPQMKPEDVDKMKKIWPARLLSSPMNLTVKWLEHLENNSM